MYLSGALRSRKMLDTLELELQKAMKHHMGAVNGTHVPYSLGSLEDPSYQLHCSHF